MSQSIDDALAFLSQETIDENGCECVLIGNPDNHCATFARFNGALPDPSIYILPRLTRPRLEKLRAEGRLSLDRIEPGELTPPQARVHQSAMAGAPVINHAGIAAFVGELEWPIHFYDYETFGGPVPLAEGYRPHQQMPVQFSLHRLTDDGTLDHFEFLADRPGMERDLVAELERAIGPEGSLIAWNMSFEKGCNERMAALLPDRANFLADLNRRTRDLEDPFKADYVDARFRGSSSIKKILPVLVPALAYSEHEVHDGTGAMQAWLRLTKSEDEGERVEIRRQLLAYCYLDSLAMVEIFRVLQDFTPEA